MTFKKWMQRFEGVVQQQNGAAKQIGDLANEMKGDERFPDTMEKDKMISYLNSCSPSCSEVVRAFKVAYKKYEKETRKK